MYSALIFMQPGVRPGASLQLTQISSELVNPGHVSFPEIFSYNVANSNVATYHNHCIPDGIFAHHKSCHRVPSYPGPLANGEEMVTCIM